MILFRIGFIAIVLFALFFGFLRLCFSKGFLTRDRLRKWNRNLTIGFFAMMLMIVVMTVLSTSDQIL